MLANPQRIPCTKCSGTGVMPYSVSDENGHRNETMDCFFCNATGSITADKALQMSAEDELWCDCGNPSRATDYHPDNTGVVNKHHWTCRDCGGILQIG